MRETFVAMCKWLAKVDFSHRVIVAPLGFSKDEARCNYDSLSRNKHRVELGLAPDDVMFINAGGAWGWTDTDTFIEAFCLFSQSCPHKFRVYFSGIKQENNSDANLVAEKIYRLADTYPRLFSDQPGSETSPIYLERDWARGGKEVAHHLAIADIGINLSKSGFEAWQSHRVRFIDYLAYGLPVLNTQGDYGSELNAEACFSCESESLESYMSVFERLHTRRGFLTEHRAGAEKCRVRYMAERLVPPVLKMIEQSEPRNVGKESKEEWFLEDLVKSEMKHLKVSIEST